MVVGIGIDLVEVARVRAELGRDGEDWKARLFTPEEVAYCDGKRDPAPHYAARFAAKEAFFKAVGTGVPDTGAWRLAEVCGEPGGAPRLVLREEAERAARAAGAIRVLLSLSHTDDWAMASVVVESGEEVRQ
jgi:holo-[acyl-carrier protein] synthase